MKVNIITIDSLIYRLNLYYYQSYAPDSYDTEEMELYWIDDAPVEVDWKEITLPQFSLQSIHDAACLEVFKTGEILKKVECYCSRS